MLAPGWCVEASLALFQQQPGWVERVSRAHTQGCNPQAGRGQVGHPAQQGVRAVRGVLGWAGSLKTADPKPSCVVGELSDPLRALPSGGHLTQGESPWAPDPALSTGRVALGVSLLLSSRPALTPLNCKTSVADTKERASAPQGKEAPSSWLLCPNLKATMGTSTSSPLISDISRVQSSKRTHPLSPLTLLPPYRRHPRPTLHWQP